jgi:hypothetical protein
MKIVLVKMAFMMKLNIRQIQKMLIAPEPFTCTFQKNICICKHIILPESYFSCFICEAY